MVMIGGYGKMGAPLSLIKALANSKAKNLTLVCSAACCPEKGSAIQPLLENKMVSKLITSTVGENQVVIDQFKKGQLEVELLPMGTLAEKARSGGYGIPAFYSGVGIGTFHDEGGLPMKYGKDGKTIVKVNWAPEKRQFHGRDYLMEHTMMGDFALVKAWKADTKGNCMLKLANRNFNPDMAVAGKICIVEADEIVEPGALDGDDIHIPGIFVHRVVKSAPCSCTCDSSCEKQTCPIGTENQEARTMMVKRAAQEVRFGSYVVLGKGLSRAVEKFVPESQDVQYVCPETGIYGAVCGCGKTHSHDLKDGAFKSVVLRKNAAIVKASDGFCGVRGGHLNLFILDSYQVSEEGDLANIDNGKQVLPSPGVNMDLAAAGTPIVAMMELMTEGKPNLLKHCTFKLAGTKCVKKLITDMGVFEFKPELTLTEIAPGVTVEKIKSKTPCSFKVASNLKTISI